MPPFFQVSRSGTSLAFCDCDVGGDWKKIPDGCAGVGLPRPRPRPRPTTTGGSSRTGGIVEGEVVVVVTATVGGPPRIMEERSRVGLVPSSLSSSSSRKTPSSPSGAVAGARLPKKAAVIGDRYGVVEDTGVEVVVVVVAGWVDETRGDNA